jgi:hypothetical protein
LQDNLGTFLLKLKTNEDNYYLKFLNKYGDEEFCNFSIPVLDSTKAKGIYCFMVGNLIKYIGRSHDPFFKRVNQGYGHISPKNCYLDGQSTNCRINSIIAKDHASISFHICLLHDDLGIDENEKLLIHKHRPEWNVYN